MAEFGLTDAGYFARSAADLEEEMQGTYEGLVGLTVDWDYDAFLGAYNFTLALRLEALEDALQALSDSRSVNNATGLALDDRGQMRLVPRLAPVKTRVTCTLTSESDTTAIVPVPTGQVVRGGGDDDRQKWVTIEDVEIPAGGGTVDVTVEAEDEGAISADPGDIDEIITPVDGWASVTNGSEITVGRPIESDAAYRRRQSQALSKAGSATTSAIRSKVLDVDNVTACNVLENEENTTQTVEGVSMEPHSIAVYVQPSTLTTDEQEEVAAAIYGKGGKSGGIKTLGSIEATTTGADDLDKTIRFSFFTEITVNVATTVTLATGYELADVDDDIKQLVIDYFAEFLGGEDVYTLDIVGRVDRLFPKAVTGVTVTLNGGGDVAIDGSELAILGTNTVT